MSSKVIFFSDPHLGLRRSKNTTPASSLLLRDSLLDAVFRVIRDAVNQQADLFCAGDFFDTFTNSEPQILKAAVAYKALDYVVSGNHDQTNVKDSVSSLHLLANLVHQPRLLDLEFGKHGCHVIDLPSCNTVVTAVPHCATQALFEQSLDKAWVDIESSSVSNEKRILVLHCNYNSDHAAEDENSLNLTPQFAEKLLERYHYILLGHEHKPFEAFDGRLIVIGNTHPTGFSDISDKRYLVWDGESFESRWFWKARDHYAQLDWRELKAAMEARKESNAGLTMPGLTPEKTFLELVGTAKLSDSAEIAKLTKALWASQPKLLAMRVETELVDMPTKFSAQASAATASSSSSMVQVVRRALPESMRPMFDDLLQKVTSNA